MYVVSGVILDASNEERVANGNKHTRYINSLYQTGINKMFFCTHIKCSTVN